MKNRTKISIFGIALIGLLVFLGYKYIEQKSETESDYYDFKEGNIKEEIVGESKILKEEKIGITMTVPVTWEKRLVPMGLILEDPETDVENRLMYFREWTQGCVIGLSVENDTIFNGFSIFNVEKQKKEFLKQGNTDYCDQKYCEIVKIGDKEMAKGFFLLEDKDLNISVQEVTYTFLDDKKKRIIRINTFFSTQVPECEEHLNYFINNLKI